MVFANRKPQIKQSDPPRSPRETLPSMYDLPSEDPKVPGLPDDFHDLQPQLLSRTLRLRGYTRNNWYTATDLNLYYDINHPLWHKRPDWFLVVDVPRLYDSKDLRRSYVIWQEGKGPDVVVGFLSPGTEKEDLGRFYTQDWQVEDEGSKSLPLPENGSEQSATQPPAKLTVYERYLRVPHYLVYSRYTQRLRYFRLEGGQHREQSLRTENPLVWLEGLEIGLGIWNRVFEEIPGDWLRWCDRDGNWFLTDTEAAQQAQAQAQLLQAAQNLLATGMGLDQVTQILGLSEDQVRQIR